MYYVRIDGIPDDKLEFFGYQFVAENGSFKLYREHHTGDDHIVDKARPALFVSDENDAAFLAEASDSGEMVGAPPKPRKQ